MKKQELLRTLVNEWANKFHYIDDKPEENPDSIIRALWLKASGVSVSVQRATSVPLPDLNEEQQSDLLSLIKIRAESYPTAYIIGRQCFMGIELITDNRALIPRKETEMLGNTCLYIVERMHQCGSSMRIMDICCGSGNLGIAIAYYNTNCFVYASDISQAAVDLTQENINLLNLNQRVTVKQGDMMSAFCSQDFYEKIDLIICNPPYISSSKVPLMDPEISKNEPKLAFDGGMLGIEIIQRLIQDSPKFLKKRGWIACEVGKGQGNLIIKLFERSDGFVNVETMKDITGHTRTICAQKV